MSRDTVFSHKTGPKYKNASPSRIIIKRPAKLLIVLGILVFFAARRFIYSFEGISILGAFSRDYSILLSVRLEELIYLQLIIAIMVVIGLVLSIAVYSVAFLRSILLAKIGCIVMIVAFLVDFTSFFPIETVLGVVSFFVLTQQDVKEAYAQKEGKPGGILGGQKGEVVFEADTTAVRAKRRYGFKCPECGTRLPPSAEVCRRCGTRIPDNYP